MPGKQVKDWDQYHAIRRENPEMSKESAARIVNASRRRTGVSKK
jgi:hypothetical protein